ncbi:MAG TPA: carboxypeptidase-like regulatory domain-containing protein [Prolixibacteraceae bacterium]|nr:carboxypeptidase-like regulatory domain-containing protein [Prolixibacteraceae bacterium]
MTKKYLLILLFIIGHISLAGQNKTTLTGKVIDKTTRQPLVFVNIGIEGTLTGTASNANGNFSLTIPGDLLEENLYFSAIGYENFIIPAADYIEKDAKVIGLTPHSYGIEDIEVSTQSMVLYRVIKDAANNIKNSFINKPYSYKSLYRNELFINQKLEKKREALVQVSDHNGYNKRKSAYTDRNYHFMNVSRNFDVETLADGTTLMDDLLSFDIARSGGNILDTIFLKNYDLSLINESSVDRDSMWVIAYKLASPKNGETDLWNASFYEGVLYISEPGRQLLKAEAHIKAKKMSGHGLSVVPATQNAQLKNVEIHYTTTYRFNNGTGRIEKVVLDKSYTKNNKQLRSTSSLQVLTEEFENPTLLDKRQYHENMLVDPDFWESLKIYQ